jgi:AcrR family transcriptional regulator
MTMGRTTERNKQQTRRLIADTALPLFLTRGFDRVTVAEIAAAAGVAEKTVYNYFPTKAQLVFDQDPAVLDSLVAAIRDRAGGVSALSAVRDCLSAVADQLGGGHPPQAQAAFRRMVAASPTLQLQQHMIAARYERALAEILAEQTGAPVDAAEPFIASVALVGALRAGFTAREASGGVGAAITRALDLLEAGLAGYGVAGHDSAPVSGEAVEHR